MLARDAVRDAILGDQNYELMNTSLNEIAAKHFLSGDQFRRLQVMGFNEAADHALDDHLLSHEEGVSSRPQIFKNVDGWFTYNLISQLNQL